MTDIDQLPSQREAQQSYCDRYAYISNVSAAVHSEPGVLVFASLRFLLMFRPLEENA